MMLPQKAGVSRIATRVGLIWLCYLSCLSCLLPSFCYGNNRVQIQVGECFEYKQPNFAFAEVSKKGVIHVEFRERDQSWYLTGLKSGFVIVHFFAENSGSVDGVMQVEVKGKLSHTIDCRELCETFGLTCQNQKRLITGEIHNPYVYYYVENACRVGKCCVFSGTLGSKGRDRIQTIVAEELELDRNGIQVSDRGSLHLAIDCSQQQKVREWIQSILGARYLQIACKTRPTPQFHLNVKFLQLEKALVDQMGVEAEMQWGVHQNHFYHSLDGLLQNKLSRQNIKVLAEPTLLLAENKTSEFKAGMLQNGEMQIHVEACLCKRDGQKLQLYYNILYHDGREHRIKNTITLAVGQNQFVGSSKIATTEAMSHELSLSQIPIIGPLFKSVSEKKEEAYVVFEIGVYQS